MRQCRCVLLTRRSVKRSVGTWVKVRSNDLGFGFLRKVQDNRAVVEYSDIPGIIARRIEVSCDEVVPTRLSKGARVWLRGDPFGWWAGEVTGTTSFGECYVRVPGIRDLKLTGEKFWVRWNRPLANPVRAVSSGMCDSPEYYEARRSFRDQLLHQRGSSRGFSAVISAAIDLFPHQLDTVARVLGDPVLRYLLADEVGLGKTVEAGLVIRQLLLDDKSATALVAVPTALVQQWRDELSDRLILGDAVHARKIRIIDHDQLAIESGLHEHSIVVIDEAHRVVAQLDQYAALRTNLYSTKGLLLLSATPMRGNVGVLLGLLNLIDPIAFPVQDRAAFERRLQDREREAGRLQLLTSRRASARQRMSVLSDLVMAYDTDPVIEHLTDKCRHDEFGQSEAWTELTNYVRETYRISRRMVRHRRNTEATETYPVAGRAVAYVPVVDPARYVVDEFLDRYRERLPHGPSAKIVYGKAVRHGLGGPNALRLHLLRRLGVVTGDDVVSADDRALFEATVAKLEMIGTTARQQVVLDVVEKRIADKLKIVVVAMSAAVAKEFCAAADRLWSGRLSRHLADMQPASRDAEVEFFLNSTGGSVLVGDYTLEEGRNLQEAHMLINLDLPLDPNRLEQRIGRLDRFARRIEPAQIVVLIEPDSAWVTSHIRLLDEGIGIFDHSVATLQRKLSTLLDSVTARLPVHGSSAFELDASELCAELADERNDVDLLEELESVAAASDFDEAAVAELRAVEQDTSKLRSAFTQLTSMNGGIGLRPHENTSTGVLRFDVQGRSIFGTSQDVTGEVTRLLSQPRTYDRRVATSQTGVAPLRIGDPLVDWLEQYLRIDERGRARALVRPCPGIQVAELWLVCDFVVEFDDAHLPTEAYGVRRRLRRRGDALLPPVSVRTFTDGAGPAGGTIGPVLERPYDTRTDRLLNGKEWGAVLAELPDWTQRCDDNYAAALAHLHTLPALTTAPTAAVRKAETEVAARLAVLDARVRRLPTAAERSGAHAELAWEKAVGDALCRGVEKPSVSVVACGAVVLWPTL